MRRTSRKVAVIAWGSLVLAACGEKALPAQPTAPDVAPPPLSAGPACAAFVITGDPRTSGGARWTYRATDAGVAYSIEGILVAPPGAGPFAGVVVSHGKGGSPEGYSARIAPTMVRWNLVVIGPRYTHADRDTGSPSGPDGASTANVARARKARQLLSCLGYVDMTRIAAHGNSMGAFVTGELLGSAPQEFLVASHTAGGTSAQSVAAATNASTAERIVTPYQLHHGDADTVVALAADQDLARILSRNGVSHELRVYRGYGHAEIAQDPGMLEAVRGWYIAKGLIR